MNELPLSERIRERVRGRISDPLTQAIGGRIRRLLNAGREYRPIFVAGAMGSGTSLLALQLGQRFDCAGVIYESAHQISDRSFLHTRGPDRFASVADYQRSILPSHAWTPEEGRRDLLDLYRSCSSGPSDIVIDKGPNTNLVRAGFLARCFPDAHFVLIFRDPIANIEGFRRKWPTFARDTLAESMRFYSEIHEAFLRDATCFHERLIVVDYAALANQHEEMLALIGSRLGLAPATRRLRIAARGNFEGRGIRNVRRSTIGIVKDVDRRANERLGSEMIAEIRATLRPLQDRLRAQALKL